MSLPQPRAILFDWDNTLVDSWHTIHHALTATFEAMGLTPWTLEEAKRNVRKSARDAFPELFGARAAEATEIFYGTFARDHLQKLRLCPGAEELLAHLAERGDIYLGVVSNKQGDLLRREAAFLGWDRWFSSLVGATDAVRDKPAPEAVAMALAGGPAPGADVWLVGDTDIDMLCAANSGCSAILIRKEPPRPGEFGDAAPLRHFASCDAFSEAIQQL